jgi:hypothetical protein
MILALGLSAACGSDEPDAEPSNRGGGESTGQTSVRNVFIEPSYASDCTVQVDAPAQLSFTAINDSSTEDETLSEISTPAASRVEIDAPPEALTLSPESSIAAGQPVANPDDADAPAQSFSVWMVDLDPGVEPGQSVPVTFTFERAGEITLPVSVDGCPTQSN